MNKMIYCIIGLVRSMICYIIFSAKGTTRYRPISPSVALPCAASLGMLAGHCGRATGPASDASPGILVSRNAHGHAATDIKRLTGDESRSPIEQKGDGIRHILGCADPTHRNRIDDRFGARAIRWVSPVE
jgi:hypothetical protein